MSVSEQAGSAGMSPSNMANTEHHTFMRLVAFTEICPYHMTINYVLDCGFAKATVQAAVLRWCGPREPLTSLRTMVPCIKRLPAQDCLSDGRMVPDGQILGAFAKLTFAGSQFDRSASLHSTVLLLERLIAAISRSP